MFTKKTTVFAAAGLLAQTATSLTSASAQPVQPTYLAVQITSERVTQRAMAINFTYQNRRIASLYIDCELPARADTFNYNSFGTGVAGTDSGQMFEIGATVKEKGFSYMIPGWNSPGSVGAQLVSDFEFLTIPKSLCQETKPKLSAVVYAAKILTRELVAPYPVKFINSPVSQADLLP